MTQDKPILAVDIGGTHVRIGAANREGPVGERQKLSTDLIRTPEPLEALNRLIRDYIGLMAQAPEAIVVGVPGFMDEAKRILVKAPNVAELHDAPLAASIEQAFNCPVYLEHDVTLRVRGEQVCGGAAGNPLVLGIYFGTGIGAGFLKNGQPLKGGPYGMELGHIHIHDDGALCGCGGRGCAEAYASGRVLKRIGDQFGLEVPALFRKRTADAQLDRCLTQFLKDQAVTIAIAATLFDPEVIVLGGGVVEMPGFPHDELYKLVEERLPPVHEKGRHRFEIAKLGWLSVLYGAIAVIDGHQKR